MSHPFFVPSGDLHIAVESPRQQARENKPLIWAHGLSGWRLNGVKKFQHLADKYQLLAFDQRGHADSSPVTNPAGYAPELMAADIGAILDYQNLERAIIGGESMGAATALRFALANPERVEALLLLAPAFSDQPNAQKSVLRESGQYLLENGLDAFIEKTAMEQRKLGLAEEIIHYLAQVRRSHKPESLATALLSVSGWTIYDDINILSQLEMPVYLLAWPNDPLHPIALAERMHAVIPNSQLEIIPSIQEYFLKPATMGERCDRFLDSLI